MAEGINLNNRFVTQDEVDERKKKRQEEWEKVRKPDEPLEVPEEPVDNRCLFDKLEEQKNKKQEEYEEQFKLKNQVKGLQDDEAQFLDFVSKRQEELEKKREEEDWQLIRQCKKAMVVPVQENTTASEKRSTSSARPTSARPTSQKRSQMSLLAGAVKRKSTDNKSGETEDKKRKHSEPGEDTSRQETDACLGTSEGDDANVQTTAQTARVIGILPGLGVYTDSSESDSSCSDSDVNTDLFTAHNVIKIEVHGHQ